MLRAKLRLFALNQVVKESKLYGMAQLSDKIVHVRTAQLYSVWRILRLANAQRTEDAYERIRTLSEKSRDIPPGLSDIAYRIFDTYLKSRRGAVSVFPEYERFGFYQGIMPPHLLDALISEIREAPVVRSLTDSYPNYYYNYSPVGVEAAENIHSFVNFDAPRKQQLSHIFSSLQAPIERCLGIPGRVLNLKAWWTPVGAKAVGMNEWHTDGMPNEICKLMVYPFGANMDVGTTQFQYPDGSERIIEGPRGLYAIIKNSAFIHRGIAPKREDRLIVELTLGPSHTIDWRMACGGPLSTYPKLPWADLPL